MEYMSQIKLHLKSMLGLFDNVKEMFKLTWKAGSSIFLLILFLQIMQGLFPVITAWLTKNIFDLLTNTLQQGTTSDFLQTFLPLLFLQMVVVLSVQTLALLNTYLNTELGRRLHLTTQSLMHRHIAGFKGLAYFENPTFYDTLQMASYGMFNGPSQMLTIFTSIVRNTLTLLSFTGIVFVLSPGLALILVLAPIPQLVAQLKIGRQRFGLMHMSSPQERKADYLGQILSGLHFAKEVRLFNLAEYLLNQFLEIIVRVQSAQRKQQVREIRWQIGRCIRAITHQSAAVSFNSTRIQTAVEIDIAQAQKISGLCPLWRNPRTIGLPKRRGRWRRRQVLRRRRNHESKQNENHDAHMEGHERSRRRYISCP